MATLHVRNVPDALYELLRAQAAREGRSIGVQAIVLLQQALGERSAFLSRSRSSYRRRSPFMERFAETAKEVVARAQEHARSVGAPEVTPAHVLLALLDDPVLRVPLERRGLDEQTVRGRLKSGPGSPERIPLTAETRALLEDAFARAVSDAPGRLSARWLLGALERTQFVRGLDVRLTQPPDPEDVDAYRAVVLEGDWTAQLNELAADGWELFSVTPVGSEVRAILRRA